MICMSAISERLKRARELAGFREATEAAQRHGWTVPTYLSHENGTRGAPVAKLTAYAGAFKVSLQWLLTGDDASRPAAASGVAEAYDPPVAPNVRGFAAAPAIGDWPRDLPVYGTAIGGNETLGAFEFNVGDTIDHIRRPPRLQGVKNAFAVFAVGESMLPRIRPGGPAIVHPGVAPAPGDDVLVELKPESEGAPHAALIKRLVSRTETRLRLQQFNPPDDNIIVPMKRVLRLYRIVPYEDLLGF
jgi:phage repressor protein C with HTH and peptisase S24 domain